MAIDFARDDRVVNLRRIQAALAGDQALLVLVSLFLVIVVAYPILSSLRALDTHELWVLLSRSDLLAIRNTAVATLLMLPPSLAIAVPMAWLCSRTNMPGRSAIVALVGMSYMMPVLFTTIAYVFLFGKNAGLLNVAFRNVFGVPLYDIYSFSGVVFVSVLQCFPLIFFTTASGLNKMNPELEESARVVGLKPLQVFFKITLSAILPSILAGVAFAIATSITMLAAPLILAVPIGIPFITTEVYAAIVMFPNITRGVALSIPLVLMTVIALWFQSRLIRGQSSRYVTVGGKGARSDRIDLHRWRVPAALLCMACVFFSVILPFLSLLYYGLMNYSWKGFVPSNLTFKHFMTLFNSPTATGALVNSVMLAVGTGVFLAIMGAVIAVVLGGEQTLLKRGLRALGMLPLGIAPIIGGVLVILAWYGSPFHLGATPWILGLGYVLILLPYAIKACEVARGQIDNSLPEAARICGATSVSTWRHVLLPLMRNGVFTTFVIVFLFCIKEFPLTALVHSANTMTLAVQIYAYYEGGNFGPCGAGAVVLLVITFGTLLLTGRIFNASMHGSR